MKPSAFLFVCGVFFSGCSVYEAVHAPSPVEYKHVQIVENRSETIALLGFPKMSDKKNDELIDYFEFFDGYNPASKARIIFYIAGDVFTACLAEVIWWPLEMSVFDGKLCRATITYGPDNLIKSYQILDSKGKSLWSSPPVSPTTISPTPKKSPTAKPEIEQVQPPSTP